MKPERLTGILQGVQDQIRFCDAKAQVVLGLNGILAGFLAAQTPAIASALARNWPHALAWGLLTAASLYLLSLLLSFAFALRVVVPRLDVSQPDSCVFFAHIANEYKNNYEQIAKNLPALSEEELAADFAKQVLANSHVCVRKHWALRNAWKLMSASLIFWIATWLVLFIAIFRAAASAATP
jgi:disulfide bond formation protein DsbB